MATIIYAAFVVPDSTSLIAAVPSPATGKILFRTDRDGNNEIYVMDMDGGSPTNLTNHPGQDFEPVWSPDGTRVAFSSDRDGGRDIFVMNADGTDPTNLTHGGAAFDSEPAWSPDGTRIVFFSRRRIGLSADDFPDLYIMNADGTGLVNLTTGPAAEFSPDWSPDGTRIAYAGACAGVTGICVVNADGSGQTLLSPLGAGPDWSPDGTKIAFHTLGAIYVMAADGTTPTRITDAPGTNRDPAWSLDGTRIAFTTNRTSPVPTTPPSTNLEIYVIDADGSNPKQLTNDAANDGSADLGLSGGLGLPARDSIPPLVTLVADRPPDANGFYNQPVVLSVEGDDSTTGGSGIASCDVPITYSGPESTAATVEAGCTDTAGNTGIGTAVVAYDASPPRITAFTGSIVDGAEFDFGAVPANDSVCEAFDATAGLNGPCRVTGYETTSGGHGLSATATDRAANQAVLTKHYTVRPWALLGFYQPVDMQGVLNVVKSGRSVPLKFEVFAGASERTNVADIASFTQVLISCDALEGATADAVALTNTGATDLRYSDGQFIANWKTPSGARNTCWAVAVTTLDGSSLRAFFLLQ